MVATTSLSSAVAIRCDVTSIEAPTGIFACGTKAGKFKNDDKTTSKTTIKKRSR